MTTIREHDETLHTWAAEKTHKPSADGDDRLQKILDLIGGPSSAGSLYPSAEAPGADGSSSRRHYAADEWLRSLVSTIPAGVYVCDIAGRVLLSNARAVELLGERMRTGDFEGRCVTYTLRDQSSPISRYAEGPVMAAIRYGQAFRDMEVTARSADDSQFLAQLNITPVRSADGRVAGALVIFEDVTERSRNATLVSGQNRALQAIVSGDPLPDVLEHLVRTVEGGSGGNAVASILLVDSENNCLRHGAAPGLPDAYNRAIDGVPISCDIGTCSRAAFLNEVVITPNIAEDPRWAAFSHLPLGLGLRAAWSMPIVSSTGKVLGTFGTYFRETRTPTPQEKEIVAVLCKSAAIAIERRATEDAMRSREQHLRAVFDTSPECVKIVAADGTLVDMNLAGYEMLEVTEPKEITGQSIYSVIAPEDRERFREMNERVCNGQRDRMEFRVIGRKGTVRWMETQAAPIKDPRTGRALHLAVTRDITARKQTEEQQRALYELVATVNRSEDLSEIYESALHALSRTQQASRAAILLSDDEGVMRFVASRGLSEDYRRAVEGHSPWDRHDPNPRPVTVDDLAAVELPEHIRDAVSTAGIRALAFIPLCYEKRLLGKVMIYYDQTHTFPGTEIHQLETIASQIAFAIERQRTADALEKLVTERTVSLRAAIAQMEEFSYSVSHDLRSPVRAVRGYAEALLEDHSENLNEEGHRLLERILRNSSRMDRLIQDILVYSRLSRQEIRLESVSLDRLIREIIDEYPTLHASNADIEIVNTLPHVLAHEASLSQVFSNLLSNAVKFVAPGQRPQVRVWTEPHGDQIRVYVRDNGIGVRPEHQKRLFGMFERVHADSRYEGTGIGLAIVRKAMERINGSTGVVSDGIHGSTFWVQLPRADDPAAE